jgi:hypothetical protein
MPSLSTAAEDRDGDVAETSARIRLEARRLARSLALAAVNLTAACAYAEAARWLMPRLSPSWHGVPYAIATGILIAQVFLLSLWLAMGSGRWWLRYLAGAAALLAGTLAALLGIWGGRLNEQTVRTVIVPLGLAVLALGLQLVAGVHLLLALVRVLAGWRLDFADLRGTLSRRSVSRARRLLDVAFLTTVSLVTIWLCRAALRPMATSELLFHPQLLLTTLLAPTLVPLAACGWLVFASRARPIAAVLMVLALAAPAMLVGTGLGDVLELETPQLWVVHWVTLSATAWAAANLTLLRWCGLTTSGAKVRSGALAAPFSDG